MESRLDPLFKTQFRQTETLDTRQGIRRQDPDEQRGKRDRKDRDDNEDDLWQDKTSVSVQTLQLFLEQLVRQQDSEDKAADIQLSPAEIPAHSTPDPNQHYTPQAAKAAQAYQRTYRATHHEAPPPVPPADSIGNITLTPDEIRTIHQLINDLNTLAARRVETLTVEKSSSFLRSLVEAVQAQL
ncbi:MAG: hypothetical protein H6867_02370 [Rhodospirillales bacterium]|nr:hypothetical protein [Rhodospirillales bacterium]MCB9997034.1 hypothetical protein [Rhodospirillales bacterium]